MKINKDNVQIETTKPFFGKDSYIRLQELYDVLTNRPNIERWSDEFMVVSDLLSLCEGKGCRERGEK